MEKLLDDLNGKHEINGAEFTVLEVCQALITFGNEGNRFTQYLSKINPYEKYHSTLEKLPPDKLHNFCMYGICAEYLRSIVTGKPADEFIERHWKVQKTKFNTHGMYMDPHCPYVYDITSRYRLALMLEYGYKGETADCGKKNSRRAKQRHFTHRQEKPGYKRTINCYSPKSGTYNSRNTDAGCA